MTPQHNQYNNIAKEFLENDENFSNPSRQELYSLVKESSPGAKLLDMGCGYGKDLQHFFSQGYSVYGIDISKEMLKLAKVKCPKSELFCGSFENMPYANEFFDIAYSRYAIQHSSKVEETLKEAHRVLKPEGKFVFLVTHPLRQFLEKKQKDYWQMENIYSKIFGKKVTVEEPSHTLDEYLSPFVLENFKIKKFIESHDPAAKHLENQKYPGYMIMQLKKIRQ